MGIYTITVKTLEKIHEVKGRFWIKAEFREHEDMWTTYDLGTEEGPDRVAVLLKTYNIPKRWYQNEDGTYQAFCTGGLKTTITKGQYYILKRVIWKYLIYSDRYDLLTQEAAKVNSVSDVSTHCSCPVQ